VVSAATVSLLTVGSFVLPQSRIAAQESAISLASAPAADQAEQVLRGKLAMAYPTVTRWEISVLPSSMEASNGAAGPHPSITVTRLGQRSAVWVGSEDLGPDRRGRLLWFNVAGYSQAVVAAHPLSAGAPLDSSDGALVERDIMSGNCGAIQDPRALTAKRAKRFFQSGEMICDNFLEALPAVARGEEVALLYIGRTFTLASKAIAQTDGTVGKRVTVRNVSSGEVFTATVTGKAEVSVNE
jgi:flagella basal body P-ring formation protein FlgA